MSRSCPSTIFSYSCQSGFHSDQSGIAMVVTLILLLVLIAMGVGIAYIAAVQSDLVSAVANKPISIDASETCFDNAIEWLPTTAGKTWVNGVGASIDLAATGNPLNGKTLLSDTVPFSQSDTRSAQFQKRAGLGAYSSCIVEKISSTTTRGTGMEIGTSNGYGASNFVYAIRITAVGNFQVPISNNAINVSFWQSNSSRTTLESVIEYTP